MSKIVIYQAKDGHIELDVNLAEDTVWLSINQMARLFGRDKSVISRHLSNIFKTNELDKRQTVANFATVQKEGTKSVKRNVDYYNLDVVISVGYRVNSKEGIQFRQWATQIIKEHIIKGYTLREQRLAERGMAELQQSMVLLQQTLKRNNLIEAIGLETLELITRYAKTWHVLLAYDEDTLPLPKQGKPSLTTLDYPTALHAIESLKTDLFARNEASALFGHEYEHGLQSILGVVVQT